jgi:tetratricopeptide (TPR) repeat protein
MAGVSNRQTLAAVQRHGATLESGSPDLVVVGEASSEAERAEAQELAERFGAELVAESELWRRLGLVDEAEGVNRLYSPAMLADLVGAPLPTVRRWVRRGYLRPVCSVQRLDYFDFSEARVAQLLADFHRQRPSVGALEREVERLVVAHPSIERPLEELPVQVLEGSFVLREDDTLREAGGQRLFDFEGDADDAPGPPPLLRLVSVEATPVDAGLRERAFEYADEGRLEDAIATWRLALLESTPTAEDHQTLADWLYATGASAAARERYYAALEVDAELLPARLSLGCVLVDLGECALAEAALRGVLDSHEASPDAHFHLARALEKQGDVAAALPHWRRFLEVAPESPWAEEARERLGAAGGDGPGSAS